MKTVPANRLPRRLTAGLGAALMMLGVLAACSGGADPEGTPRRIAREIERTLTTVAQNEIARDPELATRLGVPEDAAGFGYNRLLTDRSQAAFERARLSRLETRDLLVRVPRPARGSALARHLDTLIAAHETAETLFIKGHGAAALGEAYPYAADHLRGAYIDVPVLLAQHHPMRTPADARAYAARMAQFADAIEDERRRLEADARAGIVPPGPVLRRMITAASAAAAEPPALSQAVTAFDNLAPGIQGLDPAERAALSAEIRRLAAAEVQPALEQFAASLNELANTAPELPGIWQLPEGEAYYAASLRAWTSDAASPAGLHERGRRETDALLADLDRALAGIGLTEGTPGARLALLAARPGETLPDTEEGRAELMDRIATHAARAGARLSLAFETAPTASPVIRPADRGAATPPARARYVPEPADGSAPATLVLDLSRMADWPDYRLAATAFETTLPGRHVSATAAREARLPLARQLVPDTAFSDGWAAYAQTLADEIGLYAEDPVSRIGYLQARLIHAARLVADTGIHQERWSRDQAIDWFSATTGISPAIAADEVDRMTVWPGRAAAGWLGRSRILDLRERAIRVLGPRFDQKGFHRVILAPGPRPLAMVEDEVTRWFTAQIN
ncbi:DUF885 domain-containing protein [Hyphomonas sp.]|uniref:DUF885 domain-containing protein n=1 Tax=Hyphomonas sp. TaxID=87 RepID=UPI00391DA34A